MKKGLLTTVLAAAPLLLAGGRASAQGFLGDSDHDGLPDSADLHPCENPAVGEAFAPARGVHGMIQLEDHFPTSFDEDFNDVVVSYNYAYKTAIDGRVTELRATFNALALGGIYDHGLGFHLPVPANSVASIQRRIDGGAMQAVLPSATDAELTFVVSPDLRTELFNTTTKIINASAAGAALTGRSLEVFVSFKDPTALPFGPAPYDVYIFRITAPGHQVHLPQFCGTASVNTALFGTGVDASNPPAGRCYVDRNGLPWAIAMPQQVSYPLEQRGIANLFPSIVQFAASGGTQAQNFYLFPVSTHAYSTPPPASFPGGKVSFNVNTTCLPTRSSTYLLSSGGGDGSSPNYKVSLTIGGPAGHGTGSSNGYQVRLGPVIGR